MKKDEIKIGDMVECISETGFDVEGSEFIEDDKIRLGGKYRVEEIDKKYSSHLRKYPTALKFKGKEFAHPITSFKKIIK